MTRPRLTPDQIDQICDLREEGKTYQAIANIVGCSPETASWHCTRLGADPPNPAKCWDKIVGPAVMKRGDHVVRRFTPEEDKRIQDLRAQGHGPAEIGRTLDRPINSIIGRLNTLARRELRAEAMEMQQ